MQLLHKLHFIDIKPGKLARSRGFDPWRAAISRFWSS